LEGGLLLRYRSLIPLWVFALAFSGALYVKFKRLKRAYVAPAGQPAGGVATTSDAVAEQPTRRRFLDWLIGAGAAVVGAAMAVPALLYLWPAAKGGVAPRVEVSDAVSLAAGQSVLVQLGGKPVIVVRRRDGYRAFSAACTHLGCLVKWEPVSREFRCPCHAATFDENGGVVSGPPPTPLPEYRVEEVGDQVFVLGS
jgi:cytochrome b6-f complex iron-sulfur subunit